VRSRGHKDCATRWSRVLPSLHDDSRGRAAPAEQKSGRVTVRAYIHLPALLSHATPKQRSARLSWPHLANHQPHVHTPERKGNVPHGATPPVIPGQAWPRLSALAIVDPLLVNLLTQPLPDFFTFVLSVSHTPQFVCERAWHFRSPQVWRKVQIQHDVQDVRQHHVEREFVFRARAPDQGERESVLFLCTARCRERQKREREALHCRRVNAHLSQLSKVARLPALSTG
jgi:hypothetical protein